MVSLHECLDGLGSGVIGGLPLLNYFTPPHPHLMAITSEFIFCVGGQNILRSRTGEVRSTCCNYSKTKMIYCFVEYMCCLSQELLINTFYLEKNNEGLLNPVDSIQRLSPVSVHFFIY